VLSHSTSSGRAGLESPAAPHPARPVVGRTPIVFMGLLGLNSHNREEERLVAQLARRGHPQLYLAPLGIRDAGPGALLGGLLRLRRASRVTGPRNGLRAASLLVLPWRELPPAAALNRLLVRRTLAAAVRTLGSAPPLLWLRLPTPELVTQLGRLGTRGVVYECIDDYRAYPQYHADELRRLDRYERVLVDRADAVVTLSATVAARFPQAASRTRVIPLGVDLERFGTLPQVAAPDLDRLPRPRLGLVGGLDERVDFELLRHVALARPDWSVVLVGPLGDSVASQAPIDLPNVHALGPRPYEQVPAYLAGFDACLIPYRRTPWTLGCFPAKLHEYLASGKPVISSDLPALADYGDVVALAHDADGFLDACARAVSDTDPRAAERRRAVAREHSLEARCDELEGVIAAIRG
jgi:glycosyltransferase involved in cell wall biosynthesis